MRHRQLLLWFAVAAVFDLVTTLAGLELGYVEANPTAVNVHAAAGGVGLVALTAGGLILVGTLTEALRRLHVPHSTTTAHVMLVAGIAVNVLAGAWNTTLILG